MPDHPQTLNAAEIALRLGITTQTIRDWAQRGLGPPAVGITPRTRRYPVDAFEQWFRDEWLTGGRPR